MKDKKILLLADVDTGRSVSTFLHGQPYRLTRVDSLDALEEKVTKQDYDLFFLTKKMTQGDGKKLRTLIGRNVFPLDGTMLLIAPEEEKELARIKRPYFFDYLLLPLSEVRFLHSLRNIENRRAEACELAEVTKKVDHLRDQMIELNFIGTALSTEHDLDRLLEMILHECRRFTHADAGSLYIKEDLPQDQIDPQDRRDKSVETGKCLRFVCAQNDSLDLPFKEFTMKVSKHSISGYVAMTGEVLNIPDAYEIAPNKPYQFNVAFDKSVGYRSTSMLVLPMKNRDDEIIGVIQLINCKKDFTDLLNDPAKTPEKVIPFDDRYEGLVGSLASQAAVAIENARLYRDIRNLLEAYIESSMAAIEARDKTTSGHSRRVAEYMMVIARKMNEVESGPFAKVHFNSDDLTELRYAAALHDIGKIGVPEAVLTKQNKLSDDRMMAIEARFALAGELLLNQAVERRAKIAHDKRHSDEAKKDQIKGINTELESTQALLADYLDFVRSVNLAGFLPDEDVEKLKEVAAYTYLDRDGSKKKMLDSFEFENMSVRRGNLTDGERESMNHHVLDTYSILEKIPWLKGMSDVPRIAATHHEKLDGTGYPWGIRKSKIPLGGRILSVVDFFEALTAQDRPYRPPMTPERAIEIIGFEVKDGKLDKDIFDLFVEHKLYETVIGDLAAKKQGKKKKKGAK
jgi:HD-GYP domain-containing protein (c-di-GMP phosphodiesterase class II)/DNA-binding response OmpR family regulator